jgi:hypothetical protein
MRVGIFGVSSEIGTMLRNLLEAKGIEVVNIGRANQMKNPSDRHFDLRHPEQIDLSDLNTIFLFGWIQIPRNFATACLNYDGYEVIRKSMKNSSVRAVFISTMLANESSKSMHAIAKHKCEELFMEEHIVVRIGQVRSSSSAVIGKSARRARILAYFAQAFRLDEPLLLPYVFETSLIRELDKILTDQTEGRLTVFDGFDKLGERNRINGIFNLRASSISKIFGCINWIIRPTQSVVGDRFQALYSAQPQLFDLAKKVNNSESNSEL